MSGFELVPVPGDVRAWLRDADEDTLVAVRAAIDEELHRRALAGGDPDRVADAALRDGFDRSGAARDPRTVGGLVVLFGSQTPSGTGHDCCFVAVGDHWAWEDPWCVADRVIRDGPHRMRTVTVLAPPGEVELVVVRSRWRPRSGHRLRRAEPWLWDPAGGLRRGAGVRTPPTRDHR